MYSYNNLHLSNSWASFFHSRFYYSPLLVLFPSSSQTLGLQATGSATREPLHWRVRWIQMSTLHSGPYGPPACPIPDRPQLEIDFPSFSIGICRPEIFIWVGTHKSPKNPNPTWFPIDCFFLNFFAPLTFSKLICTSPPHTTRIPKNMTVSIARLLNRQLQPQIFLNLLKSPQTPSNPLRTPQIPSNPLIFFDGEGPKVLAVQHKFTTQEFPPWKRFQGRKCVFFQTTAHRKR